MRYYETLFIVTPEIAEEEVTPVIEKFSGILTDHGAIMAKIDNWGRRRLAYEVKKFNKGYYVLFEYGSEPEGVAEMERNFKIDEQVIRFLTVKKGDEFDPETMIQEPEPEEAPAEEAAADEAASEEATSEEAPAEEAAADEAASEEATSEEAPAEEPAAEEAAAEEAPAEEAPAEEAQAESAESTEEEPKE